MSGWIERTDLKVKQSYISDGEYDNKPITYWDGDKTNGVERAQKGFPSTSSMSSAYSSPCEKRQRRRCPEPKSCTESSPSRLVSSSQSASRASCQHTGVLSRPRPPITTAGRSPIPRAGIADRSLSYEPACVIPQWWLAFIVTRGECVHRARGCQKGLLARMWSRSCACVEPATRPVSLLLAIE
jgi:hypothetical protein